MQWKVGFATDIGHKRSQNQDNAGVYPDLGLFVVADGMGGHRGGETASALAVEVISTKIRESQSHPDWQPRDILVDAIQLANQSIHQKALEHTDLEGMGTTVTALLFKDDLLTIGHVGDSRCYYCRPQAIWQLTRDHSLVQEKLRAGLISREEVKTDRMKNVITRSVGFDLQLVVEIYTMATQPGDAFLICSDGLSGLVEDPEIMELIETHFFKTGDIDQAVQHLVKAANHNGGDDNITVVMVERLDKNG